MNKFKKVGLTALAGSLAAMSAHAADMSVSGGVNATYVSKGGANTGNPFGLESRLTFSAGGELENGMSVSYFTTHEMHNSAGHYSGELAVDMGDMGTISLDQGVGNAGIDAIDDTTPKAYEEAADGITGSGGFVNAGGSAGLIKYINSFDGVTLNAAIRKGSATNNAEGENSGSSEGEAYTFALMADGSALGAEGFKAGIGYAEVEQGQVAVTGSDPKDDEIYAIYASYAAGPVTIGAQRNTTTSASKDKEADMYSIAFNVNENLAISYAQQDIEHLNSGSTANVSESIDGIGFSYTMGGMTLAGQRNEADDTNGSAGSTEEHTELRLSFSF
jgi:outer membrane protein OmpU